MLVWRLSLVVFVACGGKTLEPLDDGGSDSAFPLLEASVDVASPNGDGSPAECSALVPPQKLVTEKHIAQTPPPLSGNGSGLTDGDYELTARTDWTGPNGMTGSGQALEELVRITSAKDGWVLDDVVESNATLLRSSSTMVSKSAGAVVITEYCGNQPGLQTNALYSFNGSTLVVRVDEGNNHTLDETFVLIGQ